MFSWYWQKHVPRHCHEGWHVPTRWHGMRLGRTGGAYQHTVAASVYLE